MDAERKPEELGIGGPVGTVEVRFFEVVSCWVRWGGWKWQADGPDEEHARGRPRQRLQALDPFFGGPDHVVGPSSRSLFPPPTPQVYPVP